MNAPDSKGVEAIIWQNDCLELLDQRILPEQETYLVYETAEAVADAIRDMVVRGGYAAVNPDSSSDEVFPNVLGADRRVEADDGEALGISLTYMLNSNVGIEVLAATPFKHDINGAGALDGVDIGETEHLPPTVSVQYNLDVNENISVYGGLGINYTVFFSENADDLEGVLGADMELELDDSWGLAVSAGVDYKIDEQWGINAGVYWIDIDTEATLEVDGVGTDTFDVEIDPMVYRLNVVYKL